MVIGCMRLFYIANARLPTEKAHGYQICKMCEAFALNGAQVTLLHPYRHQMDARLSSTSVFDYYGLRPIFEVQTLPNWDIVLLNRFIPDRWFTPLFFAHAFVWANYSARKARQQGADVYYTRDSTIAYWLVRFGIPTVYEAHVVPKGAQRWLLQKVARSSWLRLVVVLTSYIKQHFVDMGFAEDKVIVLPDGVDLSLFDNVPSQAECRQRLGLPLDRPIIGYIGRFQTMEMEKGISDLVRAMKYVPSYNNSEPLLLCVGGPMDIVPKYLEIARQEGVPESRLKFVDRVPNVEVPYWIRACDGASIPWPWTEFSAYYTSPLKLFEYMAAGVPIVASDLPSIREVLRHGENAWLVPPGDPKALAEGIRHLLENPDIAKMLAQQVGKEVQRYTWKRRAATILPHVFEAQKVVTKR